MEKKEEEDGRPLQ